MVTLYNRTLSTKIDCVARCSSRAPAWGPVRPFPHYTTHYSVFRRAGLRVGTKYGAGSSSGASKGVWYGSVRAMRHCR